MKNLFYLCFIFLSCNEQPKKTAPAAENKPPEKNYVIKYNQEGGPFVVIGQGTCDGYAPNRAVGHWWYTFSVTIKNNTDMAMVIKPADFRLYLSSSPDITTSIHYLPTDIAINCQPGYLGNDIIDPGNERTGTLTYELPDKLGDNTPTNGGAYKIIRWMVTPPGDKYKVIYDPY